MVSTCSEGVLHSLLNPFSDKTICNLPYTGTLLSNTFSPYFLQNNYAVIISQIDKKRQ